MPDILLILVVFFALLNGEKQGPVYGFFCGLLEDLYVGRFIGMNALSKCLTALVVGRLQGNVFKENIMVGISGVILGSLVNSFFVLLLSLVSLRNIHWDLGIMWMIGFQLIYNIVLAGPIYVWYYHSSRYGWLRYRGDS